MAPTAVGEGSLFTIVLSPEENIVNSNYLVIIAAGDSSLHLTENNSWYDHGFDICVVYYGNNAQVANTYERMSSYYFKLRAPKWQLVRHALQNVPWETYDYIWLPDDDLLISGPTIMNMFQIASDHKLVLGQPALVGGNCQHKILAQRPKLMLHYTNFIEIMCPFFQVDTLKYLFPTFDNDDTKSGWGLDFLWASMLNFSNIGVIDAAPVHHARPGQSSSSPNSFYKVFSIDPVKEFKLLRRKYHAKIPFKIKILREESA